MASNFHSGNQTLLWLSVGVTACVVGGILFGVRRSSTARRTRRCRFDDQKDGQSDEDAATIIKRLQEAEWNISVCEFLDGLTFDEFEDRNLRIYAGELWFAMQNDIKSLEIVRERFSSAKEAILLLDKILEVYRRVLKLLRHFSKKVLLKDLAKHVVSAEAQSFSHSLYFMANRGSCAEVVAALTINIPVRNLQSKRLLDDLVKYRSLTKKQLSFLDLLAQMIPDFHKLAENALNEALRVNRTSWSKIESSAKVLQESEKLFWDFCLRAVTMSDIRKSMQRASFWQDLMLPATQLDGVLDVIDLGKRRQVSAPVISATTTKSKDMKKPKDMRTIWLAHSSEEFGRRDTNKSAGESPEEQLVDADGKEFTTIEVGEESN